MHFIDASTLPVPPFLSNVIVYSFAIHSGFVPFCGVYPSLHVIVYEHAGYSPYEPLLTFSESAVTVLLFKTSAVVSAQTLVQSVIAARGNTEPIPFDVVPSLFGLPGHALRAMLASSFSPSATVGAGL